MVKQNNISILLSFLFALLILFLSITPTDVDGETPFFYFNGIDKVVHALMYGVFSILVVTAYLNNYIYKFRTLVIVLSAIWFYSILMELVQHFFVEYRSGEILDAVANLAGILLSTGLLLTIRKIRS